jgi:hypothetical protein
VSVDPKKNQLGSPTVVGKSAATPTTPAPPQPSTDAAAQLIARRAAVIAAYSELVFNDLVAETIGDTVRGLIRAAAAVRHAAMAAERERQQALATDEIAVRSPYCMRIQAMRIAVSRELTL